MGKMLWFSTQIPRVSLVMWLAIRNRLNTNDKMLKFGITQDPRCGICQVGNETIDHLIF